MSPDSAQDRLKSLATRLNLNYEDILGELRPQADGPVRRNNLRGSGVRRVDSRGDQRHVRGQRIGASGDAALLHNSEVVMIGGAAG